MIEARDNQLKWVADFDIKNEQVFKQMPLLEYWHYLDAKLELKDKKRMSGNINGNGTNRLSS